MTNPYSIGPNAPFRNPPINAEYYEPSRFVITAISEGINTVITTQIAHNYVIGQEIRLLIPVWWGAYQLNKETGFVINIPSPTQVTVGIDSVGISPFALSNPSPQYPQQPQIIAIGDLNTGNINANGQLNYGLAIPGSFQNISPL